VLNVASNSILTPTIEEQRVTRIAWVTGAGKGIGQQVSLELANDLGQAHLLKIPVGRSVPEHGHNGREMTLVLVGRFKDEFGSFSRGDVQDVDQDTVHQPVAGMVEDCVCLAVTDAPLDFKSFLPRIAQPFIRKFLNVDL